MRSLSGIKDPAFKDALALTRAGPRAETERYLIEDAGMVRQALASPTPVFAVFALPDEASTLAMACAERGAPLYVLGAGLMNKLVGTGYETAVTAAAVVGQRLFSPPELPIGTETLILAGERIQDPRNVGVLVRTAEAAGCAALLLSTDSSEPFARAAVRSTTGSILRLPLCLAPDLPGALSELAARGARVVATSARAERLAFDAPLGVRPLVLVVGNESEGISPGVRAAGTDFVALPMARTPSGGASSLNVTVAAGVLLYEAIRQARS